MQKIVNVRIDERLIHGQVAALWKGTLNATRIMVIEFHCIVFFPKYHASIWD